MDVWELDDVRWIFEPQNTEEVKAHGKTLTTFRDDSSEYTVFLQTVLALKTPGLSGDSLFQGLAKGSKDLEESVETVYLFALVFLFLKPGFANGHPEGSEHHGEHPGHMLC